MIYLLIFENPLLTRHFGSKGNKPTLFLCVGRVFQPLRMIHTSKAIEATKLNQIDGSDSSDSS